MRRFFCPVAYTELIADTVPIAIAHTPKPTLRATSYPLTTVYRLLSTSNFLLLFKHPFLIKCKADEHVNDICNDVCEVCGLHEFGDESGKACTPGGIFENIDAPFENKQVDSVRAKEHDNKACDFCSFFIGALEVPNAVAKITVESACYKSEKIREFQVPIENLMEDPDGDKRN